MSFNELNSVEHYIIQQLTGVNLNAESEVGEEDIPYSLSWKYVASEERKKQSE